MPAALPHVLSGPHRRQQWPVLRTPDQNGLLIALKAVEPPYRSGSFSCCLRRRSLRLRNLRRRSLHRRRCSRYRCSLRRLRRRRLRRRR